MKSLIQSMEVSYFIHATEERLRVDDAVASLIGAQDEPSEVVVEGHFGNPIVMASFRLSGEQAQSAASALFSKMPPDVREGLRRNLGDHMDEHSALYLRLDKQSLVAGEVALTDSDPVRVKVKPRLHALGGSAARFFAGMLE